VAPAAPATATVLLVDDVADMRRFIGDVLASEYRVVMAEDGLQALEMARRLQPDIVVSDVMMPRMTGYELCDALKRESGELARVPVILLSAKADLATKLEGLEHGADDYLVKPFNARELQSRVRNLLHLRLHERELVRALHALEERDAIITDDLRQAREFQQSTLPELPYVPGMHLSAAYRPLHMVGGDFYDLFVTETGALRVFIADATGHGVRASLVTMCIKGEYEAIKHRSSSPGEVLRALNDRITRVYGHLGVRFTAACADIEAVHGRLDLACAAHPPPCIVRGDRAELSASGGEFLGLRPGAAVFEERHLLQAGDRVHLYTDGLTEQWNRRGESFGEEGLLRVLARHTGDGGSHAPSIVDQITEFVGGAEQLEDDLTLVSIELYEAAPGTVPAAKEGMQ
jgi:sigma-B regulation protein RsbU (phosphoserine phosphatase)